MGCISPQRSGECTHTRIETPIRTHIDTNIDTHTGTHIDTHINICIDINSCWHPGGGKKIRR